MLLYFFVALVYFVVLLIKTENKTLGALIGAGYFVGTEVFLRMAKASPTWDTGKYMVILFSMMGILYLGFKKKAVVGCEVAGSFTFWHYRNRIQNEILVLFTLFISILLCHIKKDCST